MFSNRFLPDRSSRFLRNTTPVTRHYCSAAKAQACSVLVIWQQLLKKRCNVIRVAHQQQVTAICAEHEVALTSASCLPGLIEIDVSSLLMRSQED